MCREYKIYMAVAVGQINLILYKFRRILQIMMPIKGKQSKLCYKGNNVIMCLTLQLNYCHLIFFAVAAADLFI